MAPDTGSLVAFRVDASVDIGTGHVMRCLTLADTLHARGARCIFLCRHMPGEIAAEIEQRRHQIIALVSSVGRDDDGARTAHASWLGTSQQADAEECIAHLHELAINPDWLIVDHYALDAAWERSLQPHVQRIFAVDDLADRTHAGDILLDQNLHAEPARRYYDRVDASCSLLLGPRYALLRPEFAAARRQMHKRKAAVKRLLVSMGGIDRDNDTSRVIDAFLALKRKDLLLDVIASRSNPHLPALSAACDGHANITLRTGADNMAQLMATADLAVGAGGISTWERCCLGLPALVIAIAVNQEPGCRALAREGAIRYLGPRADVDTAAIHAELSDLLSNVAALQSMSETGAALVDGEGAARVARTLTAAPLQLRAAAATDSADMLTWRNHEDTRRFSENSGLIADADHQRWFAAALADPTRRILIAEEKGQPVGVLRYDVSGGEALVSIYLVPGNSGRGLGPRLLAAGERWLTEQNTSVRRMRAHVLHFNAPSMRAFEAAGFMRDDADFLKILKRHDR